MTDFSLHSAKLISPQEGTETTVHGRGGYQTGCWVDGYWGQYGASRVIRIAAGLGAPAQFDVDAALYIAEHVPGEAFEAGVMVTELAPTEYVIDLADEAEQWLNDRTEGPYSWGWDDGEFFLRYNPAGQWQCTVETIEREPVAVLSWSGSHIDGASIVTAIFRATFEELDEDGDETGDTFTVWGQWSGGCYIDLGTVLDAEDMFSDVRGYIDGGSTDVANISNVRGDQENGPYTIDQARKGFEYWCAGYVNPEDGESQIPHDFSHYGFGA